MTSLLSENGLISADDLYYLLGGPERIKLLDATYATIGGLSPYQAFLKERIKEAQFFDIDAVADQESPLPHMLPDADYFADSVSSLGISNDDHVVIYDQSGVYMAASRAWWMFRTFGHNRVYVLNGGLQSWKAHGFPLADGPADSPAREKFASAFRPELVVSKNDLLDNLETNRLMIVDVRAAGRFDGLLPEPREGMRPGHIPGSVNLPFTDVIDSRSGLFKSDEALEDLFSQQDLPRDANLASSCGSGVTSCTLALALFKARGQECAIYDGSWSEWGATDAGTPVEVSA